MTGTIFVRSPAVLWRAIDDEIVMTQRGREDFDILSVTASAVWHMLEHPSSEEDLVRGLAAMFGADPGTIRADVRDLLRDFIDRRLVEEVADADD